MKLRSFSYCPDCGAPGLAFDGVKRYSCETCGLVFYQNTAAACGAILRYEDKILLLRRAREPARGMLDFPGGFIDPGEGLEEGLRREIIEEIGVEPTDLTYLTSGPNEYVYRGLRYDTCDVVFTGVLLQPPREVEEEEVEECVLLTPEEITLDDIAFPSLRDAMAMYLSRIQRKNK